MKVKKYKAFTFIQGLKTILKTIEYVTGFLNESKQSETVIIDGFEFEMKLFKDKDIVRIATSFQGIDLGDLKVKHFTTGIVEEEFKKYIEDLIEVIKPYSYQTVKELITEIEMSLAYQINNIRPNWFKIKFPYFQNEININFNNSILENIELYFKHNKDSIDVRVNYFPEQSFTWMERVSVLGLLVQFDPSVPGNLNTSGFHYRVPCGYYFKGSLIKFLIPELLSILLNTRESSVLKNFRTVKHLEVNPNDI